MASNTDKSEECPACGATPTERRINKPNCPQDLSKCPHCGGGKCCMCDMGDDVCCSTCENEDD